METLPLDVTYYCISIHLDVLALSRCMAVSKKWLRLFVNDRAWSHIMKRVRDKLPLIQIKNNDCPKSKKLVPNWGTRFHIKRDIFPLTNFKSIKKATLMLSVLQLQPYLKDCQVSIEHTPDEDIIVFVDFVKVRIAKFRWNKYSGLGTFMFDSGDTMYYNSQDILGFGNIIHYMLFDTKAPQYPEPIPWIL